MPSMCATAWLISSMPPACPEVALEISEIAELGAGKMAVRVFV